MQSSTAQPLRCLLIDDSSPFLDAARRLLEREGVDVVGVGANGSDAFRLVTQLRPDVTIVDVDLGTEDGLAVVRGLATLETAPAGKLILISTHAEDEFADLIEASPAIGFISKSSLSSQAIHSLIDTDRERLGS